MHYIDIMNFETPECPYVLTHTRFSNIYGKHLDYEFGFPNANAVLFGLFGEDSTLRAFKFKKVIYTYAGIVDDLSTKCYALVNIAGVGEKWVAIGKYDYIYESVEEYGMSGQSNVSTTRFFNDNTTTLRKCLKGKVATRPYGNDHLDLIKWGWVDNTTKYTSQNMQIAYDCEMQQVIVRNLSDTPDYKYISKAECYANNEVKVATFEDEGEKEYEVMIEVIKTINTTIKCKSKDIAVNAAVNAFEGKNFKVFVDGEIEYESN